MRDLIQKTARRCKKRDFINIEDDAEKNDDFLFCLSALSCFQVDDPNFHALDEYLTYGQDGSGFVCAKVLKVLAEACKEHKRELWAS